VTIGAIRPYGAHDKLARMLYMVIEHFKDGDAKKIGERFRESGRMLPEGVAYHASWIDGPNMRCYQVMESPSMELLKTWTSRWDDLVDFEIVPVVTSAEFWASKQSE
jgi:hypothetical protein